MDGPIAEDSVMLGPGEGGAVKADRAELFTRGTTRFVRVTSPGAGEHVYRVTRVIGGRHFVLEYPIHGELEFHVGDEVFTATPGSYVLAPPNVVHYFRNMTDKPVRLLNLHTPGGFVRYRTELRELRAQGIEQDSAFFERNDVFDVPG